MAQLTSILFATLFAIISLCNGQQSTTCGGVIETQHGGILYKVGEQLDHNERCVWTARVPSSTLITVRKFSTNFDLSHDFITVISYGLTTITQYLGRFTNDAQSVIAVGPVVSIVLTTNHNGTSDGFTLSFDILAGLGPAHYWTDYQNTAGAGSLRYPFDGTEYQNNELSTFVIGDNNRFNEFCEGSMRMYFNYTDFESCCDNVYVLGMNYLGIDLLEQFSGSGERGPYTTDDTFVIVFSSDSSAVRGGFSVTWSRDESGSGCGEQTTTGIPQIA